jgi:hypothetical protein
MDLHSRRELMDATWKRYRQASKAGKTRILDEFCKATGYHRKYAIGRIGRVEECGGPKRCFRRKRKPLYGADLMRVVEKIWEEAGYPWSVRLKVILALWRPWIRKRYSLTSGQEALLLQVSPRTIDRALEGKKRELRRRIYGRTKPGTLLRHQIPIKCEHWDVQTPGHLELDTVSHSGENASGTFAFSFNLTDIGSTWVETRTVLGKGAFGIREAFEEMRRELPFKVLAIDSDNGSEFINNQMVRYCDGQDITFTRSRPYKKDDNAHIEQKNWTHVRKLIGWDRYDTPEAIRAMNDLFGQELRLYMNLFQPSVKLIRTVRKGSRKTRRYDLPQTPLDRLAAMPGADRAKVNSLLELRTRLNPFDLAAVIRLKLDRIWRLRSGYAPSPAKKATDTSEIEIARTLSRTLGVTRANPMTRTNSQTGVSLG